MTFLAYLAFPLLLGVVAQWTAQEKGLRPIMADAEDIEGPTTILSLVLETEDPTPAG